MYIIKMYILLEFINKGEKMDRKKINEKITYENGEDTTKYGEFISSYFAWVSLPEQKNTVNRLENITKDK